MIRQDRQITDLKQELRKYEYQVDILTEQTHQQTEDFISNLKHSATSPTFKLDNVINSFCTIRYIFPYNFSTKDAEVLKGQISQQKSLCRDETNP